MRIPARDRAWRCLARYACGTPWNSASRAAGSVASGGSIAARATQCRPHSTPSASRITRMLIVRNPWPPVGRWGRMTRSEAVDEEALQRPADAAGLVVEGALGQADAVRPGVRARFERDPFPPPVAGAGDGEVRGGGEAPAPVRRPS